MKRRIWTEWMLNGSTAIVVAAAAYFLAAERVIPALRGDPTTVEVGDRLTERLGFRALGMTRDEAEAGVITVPGARPAVLLVFSTTCPACYANLSAWRDILNALRDSASVFAVTVERDGPAALAYAGANLPRALAVRPADVRRFVDALGVSVVPLTALIDTEGVVRFIRRGSLDSTAVATAIRALGALSGSSLP